MAFWNRFMKGWKQKEKPAEKSAVAPASLKTEKSAPVREVTPVEKEKTEEKKPSVVADSVSLANRNALLLEGPHITEKAARLGAMGQYVFRVALKANKSEIASAVSAVYKVHPVSVNIVRRQGKGMRFGGRPGVRGETKKAIVTVKKGETITMHSGV